MSAQTGIASPSGPLSSRWVDRARYRAERLRTEPNPIWMRELKQAARLTRTPAVLSIIAILMTLLMASIGGVLTTTVPPATTGMALFHVFFSLAYFVVTLVGPAMAANSIASEREGRTWEAVLLTGLRPSVIARGKFLAAYTSIAMYIVMLAPVGAIPFLFGGVTAVEVVAAFILLFAIALLSVAFGLAISSKMSSLRTAIVVTLLLAFPTTLFTYLTAGVGLGFVAGETWAGITPGVPVWLPIAYARAPFGVPYLVYLVVIPLVMLAIPAWFLYEVTIANLTSITDDRSTGLKRWFVVAAPIATMTAAVPVFADASNALTMFEAGAGALILFFTYAIFLFQGDPIGPSRRVVVGWDRMKAGALRRFLGPGVMRSAALLLGCALTSLVLLTLSTGLLVRITAGPASSRIVAIAAFGGYAAAFIVFLIGFAAWTRARCAVPASARLILFGVLFGVCVGPWVLAAIAGIIADPASASDAMIVAAPSPFYPLYVAALLERGGRHAALVGAGIASAAGWALLGLVFVTAAGRRCARIIRAHEAALAEGDRRLAAEESAS